MATCEIKLQGSTLDEVKRELEVHLTERYKKPGKSVTNNYAKSIFGFECLVGDTPVSKSFIIPIKGILEDFTACTDIEIKKPLSLKVEQFRELESRSETEKVPSGLSQLKIKQDIPSFTHLKFTITNSNPTPVNLLLGFTFSQGAANEILETGSK